MDTNDVSETGHAFDDVLIVPFTLMVGNTSSKAAKIYGRLSTHWEMVSD
jgi:hypothetical protein